MALVLALAAGLGLPARAAAEPHASAGEAVGAAEAPADAPESPQAGRPIAASLALGAGAGARHARMPTALGTRTTPASAFPALSLILDAQAVSRGGVSPGARLSYRTSVGYTLHEVPLQGAERSSAARTHELRLAALLNVNSGDSVADVSVPLALGYALANLRTDAVLGMPRYTLAGPHVGLGLRVPLVRGRMVLMVIPDVQWIVQVSEALRAAGVGASGVAFGGEAQVAIQLSARFALHVQYRESRSLLSSARPSPPFSEIQRFATAAVALTY